MLSVKVQRPCFQKGQQHDLKASLHLKVNYSNDSTSPLIAAVQAMPARNACELHSMWIAVRRGTECGYGGVSVARASRLMPKLSDVLRVCCFAG